MPWCSWVLLARLPVLVNYELCAVTRGRRGLQITVGLAFSMRGFWLEIQRYSRQIVVIPILLGIALVFITRHTYWFQIGVVWFLGVIAAYTAAETFISVRGKLPRRRRDALVAFLQYGGYSFAAASVAAYFALDFWTPYRPGWLVKLMFGGIFMFFSSGLVYKRRPRKSVAKHN
jgi:hypothetical protein